MKSYVPSTPAERQEMLEAIGLSSFAALYADVPESLRLGRELNLPGGMSELSVRRLFAALARQNNTELAIFRGAGAYHHYIPAAVPQLASRSEFYTAYTPYQAEMSQGMLQAIFEWQTLICELTGMDVANASVYDGPTASAEAMHMLTGAKRKNKVAYSAGLHPDVIATMKTYARFSKTELVEVPLAEDGRTDCAALEAALAGSAGFFAAQPNFMGCLEDMAALAELTHAAGGLFVSYVNPITLGLLKRPAAYGADVAIGDGQPLGLDTAFGGPYLGFMATTNAMTRKLPGRIVGQTTDVDGKTGYVLTLSAREQHIRREKASSNICSNQALCAFSAGVYMAAMGEKGMKQCARLCTSKAHYFASELAKAGCTIKYKGEFFHEFVTEVECPNCRKKILDALEAEGILGGAEVEGGILWCVTELASKAQLDRAVAIVKEVQ